MGKTAQLSERRRKFVEAYMGKAHGNASEAARIAGYKTPGVEGCRLLKDDKVRAAIAEREQADPLVTTREERMRWLASVIRGDLTDKDGGPVETDVSHRLKALELAGKASGDYVKRVDHTTKGDALPHIMVHLPSDGSLPS